MRSDRTGCSSLLSSQILEQLPPDLHPLYTSGKLLPIHPDDGSSILIIDLILHTGEDPL